MSEKSLMKADDFTVVPRYGASKVLSVIVEASKIPLKERH